MVGSKQALRYAVVVILMAMATFLGCSSVDPEPDPWADPLCKQACNLDCVGDPLCQKECEAKCGSGQPTSPPKADPGGDMACITPKGGLCNPKRCKPGDIWDAQHCNCISPPKPPPPPKRVLI